MKYSYSPKYPLEISEKIYLNIESVKTFIYNTYGQDGNFVVYKELSNVFKKSCIQYILENIFSTSCRFYQQEVSGEK